MSLTNFISFQEKICAKSMLFEEKCMLCTSGNIVKLPLVQAKLCEIMRIYAKSFFTTSVDFYNENTFQEHTLSITLYSIKYHAALI